MAPMYGMPPPGVPGGGMPGMYYGQPPPGMMPPQPQPGFGFQPGMPGGPRPMPGYNMPGVPNMMRGPGGMAAEEAEAGASRVVGGRGGSRKTVAKTSASNSRCHRCRDKRRGAAGCGESNLIALITFRNSARPPRINKE